MKTTIKIYTTLAGWLTLLAATVMVFAVGIRWNADLAVPAWELGMMITAGALGLFLVRIGGCTDGVQAE